MSSVKYSSKVDNPQIEIGGTATSEKITYYVKDNGAGFNMAHSSRMFQVFNRLHSKSEFEGTGIGLALVHRIITKHGCTVRAEGEVGKGATFYFCLPTTPVVPNAELL